jgi:hypothetical protein
MTPPPVAGAAEAEGRELEVEVVGLLVLLERGGLA